MAEGMTQSGSNYASNPILERATPSEHDTGNIETSLTTASKYQAQVIWTPRFIIVFALTFICGLSASSLLTQGYSNNYFAGETVLLVGCGLLFVLWLAVAKLARSLWERLGAIFGCVWVLFASATFVTSLLHAPSDAAITIHATAAANLALFASYLCFSLNRTPLKRWDNWFLRLAPLIAAGIVVVSYVLARHGARSVHGLETTLAVTMLYLSICTFWLRPSCWRVQPGVTLLLGIAPIFVLLTTTFYSFTNEVGFSYLQVCLVFFMLGALRILQGELKQSEIEKNAVS